MYVGGLVNTSDHPTLIGDDVLQYRADGTFEIHPGPNGIIDTPLPADAVLENVSIVDGRNRRCDTIAEFGDNQVRNVADEQMLILEGYDDWSNLEYTKLMVTMGGMETFDIPDLDHSDPEADLTFEEWEVTQKSDIAILGNVDFDTRSKVLTYNVKVKNYGEADAVKGVNVFIALPMTSTSLMCNGPVTCSPILSFVDKKPNMQVNIDSILVGEDV